eukprot:16448835-Heterocapsa_arctica.AAC.1
MQRLLNLKQRDIIFKTHEADLIIVKDLEALDDTVRWVSAMRGCMVSVTKFLLSGGASGPCVAFSCATHTRRWFWMSLGFKREHPEVAELVVKCKRKWVQLSTALDWCRRTAAKPKQCAQCIAFVTEPERVYLKNHRYAMTQEAALEFLRRVDHARSCIGMGRS